MNARTHDAELDHCAIFIRSYRFDLEWLRYCLESIERFCTGFSETVVVIPESSLPWARRAGLLGADARFEVCADARDDYLGQQATKLAADTYTDAGLICHVDSDCVFRRQTRPADLIDDGRPRVLLCDRALLGRHQPWHEPTERFLGWPVEHDFMRHPPFAYPRWLYPELRDHCRAVHGTDLESYVTSRPARGFSEFNALGAFAHHRHRGAFTWVDVGPDPVADPACAWYWSRSGITPEIRLEIEGLLGSR